MLDIQLIKAPCNETGMPEDKWYMPLNLIWLSSYIEQYGFKTEILDGQLLDVGTIKNRIHSGIIGISFDILSIQSFNEIVAFAKSERNCTVIVGGQYATPVAEQILKKNASVDFVIRYDGEEALLSLLKELIINKAHNYHDVPNLSWRDKDAIRHNKIINIDLSTLPLPRRDIAGLDIEQYIASYQESLSVNNLPFSYKRPTNAYSIKGCPRRSLDTGCSFCSRIYTKLRMRCPQQVFDEFKYLEDIYAIDYISDFSDNWVIKKWLKQLIEVYEINGGINAKIRIYADPRDINDYTIVLLKLLGVDTVLLGIESGDEYVLKKNGKVMSIDEIIRAVTLLGKYDMKVSDAYVLGLIGESDNSLKKTVELARRIRRICQTEISYWNILTPMPGSIAWKLLSSVETMDSTYNKTYEYNTVNLENIFITHFTELGKDGYNKLIKLREQMLGESVIPSREFVPIQQSISYNNYTNL